MVQNNKTSELRFTFIGMVFALAISNVGIQLSDFVNNGYSVFCYPDVLTHLFLFIFIIASSWIGWKNSNASGNKQDIADCFGISFIILLLDLFLVFCYFILVESVKRLYNAPDYKSEILWSLIIFIGYFFWDIITIFEVKNKNRLKIKIHWKDLLSDGYQSLTCAIILCLLYFLLKDNNPTKYQVCIVDFLLLLIFILFRGSKAITLIYKDNKSILRRLAKMLKKRVNIFVIKRALFLIITTIILPIICIIGFFAFIIYSYYV